MAKNILIVAGDVSGDIHAAGLIRALKAQDPEVCITAVGGKNMQPLCDCFLLDLASQGATGFVEPLKKLPLWFSLLHQLENYMDTAHPVAVIVVDFYGFNHHVLKAAAKRHIPAYYYVTPQVWASRQYRAKKLANLTRKMFVIYPFEPAFHQKFGGNAVFLGNPLLDFMPAPAQKKYEVTDPASYPWKLGILPGSRPGEIKRLAPVFYQAFKQVVAEFPNTHAYLFLLPDADEKAVAEMIGEPLHPQFHFVKDTHFEKRKEMDFLLACSGTATLENALLGVPMIVAYKMFWPTALIAGLVIKVRFISLVNILADKELVKELLQHHVTPQALASEAIAMFKAPQRLAKMHAQLLELRAQLGQPGVAERAAREILDDLKK